MVRMESMRAVERRYITGCDVLRVFDRRGSCEGEVTRDSLPSRRSCWSYSMEVEYCRGDNVGRWTGTFDIEA